MKLLSPTQSNEIKQQQVSRDLLRLQEMEKATAKARKNLADAEADFNTTLAKNRMLWALEEEEHSKRLIEMEREVSVLENRRKDALIPVDMLKRRAETELQEATDYLVTLKKREEDTEELADKLQDKLDELGAKEQDLNALAAKLELLRGGIVVQSDQIKEGQKKLNEAIIQFNAEIVKTEKALEQRKTAVILLERSQSAKTESLKRTEQGLQEWAIRLQDERFNLDQVYKEIETKRKLSP